jgi:charged multivesicular body protein 4
MNLFGKKKQTQAAPRLNDAILALKAASENLEKREEHLLHAKEEARVEGLKKMKSKDKNGAMFFLRRMRMHDKEISQLYGKRMNLDTQIMALQSAAVDKTVISAMQTAHLATKASVSENDIDRVQDLMDDIRDTSDMVEQIGEALAQPISGDTEEIGDDELLAAFEKEEETAALGELDEVGLPAAPAKVPARVEKSAEQREADELAAVLDMPAAPSAKTDLPAVPTRPLPAAASNKEADELKKLEALMNM